MSSLNKRNVSRDTGSISKKFEQGLRLQAQDRHAEAVSRFRKVLAAEPDHTEALCGLVQSLIATERSDEAVRLLDEVIDAALAAPSLAQLQDLAAVCLTVEYFEAAERLCREILELNPACVTTLINLGAVLDRQGETQAAVDLLSRAIELDPGSASAYGSLGRVLANAAMLDEAIACYRRAIELDPNRSSTYTNLAAVLETSGRFEEMLLACEQALQINPDCDATRWNLARALLATGYIEEGWDMYGFGFASGQRLPLRPFPGLIWEGEDLKDKTIMVWREQGLGDDILFSTCYTDLIAKAGHVIIETNPRLVSLYQRTWPEATVRAETPTSTGHGNYGKIDFDVTAPAGMVAAQLRRSLDAFPAEVNRLVPDPARVAECRAWLDSLGPGPKIGLSWSSRVVTKLRSLVYTDLADWKQLFAIEGAHIINLQYTDVSAEADALFRDCRATLHSMPDLDLFNDIEGAAALSSCLDVAVAPASFPLVLAAAVGVPCFHYLPQRVWTKLGTDGLPWLPHVRCYVLESAPSREALTASIAADVRAFTLG